MEEVLGDRLDQLSPARRPTAHSGPEPAGPVEAEPAGGRRQQPLSWADLTADWLLTQKPSRRADCLRTLQSWLERTSDPSVPAEHTVEPWLEFMTSRFPGRESEPAPARTIAGRRRVLASWYDFLIEHGACDHNPAAAARAPAARAGARRGRRPRTPALSPAASAVVVEQALAQAERAGSEAACRDAALITTLYYTAITAKTLLAADLTALIGSAKPAVSVTLRVGHDHPQGPVLCLPSPAGQMMREYLTRRADRRHLHPGQLRGPVFVTLPARGARTAGDRRLTAGHVQQILTRLARQAGVPARSKITPCPTSAPTHPVPALPPITEAKP